MEITLEKIELVKDRTGVSYREAKSALEEANGSVVDAIILIEETIKIDDSEGENLYGNELFARLKKTAEKGNMSRIIIKKGEDVLINLPLTVGILGVVIAPWGMILGLVAAAGFNCNVEFVNDKGEVTDVNGKVKAQYSRAKSVGSETVDKIKDSELYNDIRVKSQDTFEDLKDKSFDTIDHVKKNVNLSDLKRKGSEILKKRSKGDEFDFSESDLADEVDEYYDLDIENLGPDQPGNVFVDNEDTNNVEAEEK
nr:DUF4342 domain-containing protein [uncultured Mogibacterium sp.]